MQPTQDTSGNPLEKAKRILSGLPEHSSIRDILFAIHSQSEIDSEIENEQRVRQISADVKLKSKWSSFIEALGCLAPAILVLVFFLCMPLLFSLGERILARPAKVLETGTIISIELVENGDATKLIGRKCKVLYDHVVIDVSDGKVIVPNNGYIHLKLKPVD